jgi:ATP-dependent helicase/nuclease subunit B
VIDYKTGSPPSKKRMEAGFASQLGLLGGMAEVGGFRTRDGDPVPAGVVTGLAYWKLGGGTDPGEIRTVFKGDASVAEHVADVYDRAEALVAALLLGDSPFVPKRRPELSWSDYDRLARVPEWLGREDRR